MRCNVAENDGQTESLPIADLAAAAWNVRQHSRLFGKTPVGCAALDERGVIHAGCNIEHRFRSHDIHAEISATSALVSSGAQHLVALLIAADRDLFTPCGACLDWIFELGGDKCIVLVQQTREEPPSVYTAKELMPHYPR
jgi:cytidine deaminase